MRVLEGKKDFTLESLIAAAYDSYQPAFATLIPPLLKDWDHLSGRQPAQGQAGRTGEAASRLGLPLVGGFGADLAGGVLGRGAVAASVGRGATARIYRSTSTWRTKATAQQRLDALAAVSDKLEADFGTWKTPWGEINRFQRLTDDIVHPFSDCGPSIPVPFTSARWGSLASFGARSYNGSKKIYGSYGNSFVAVVEFGDSVRARAITAGGESGDPESKHFNDQAERYAKGDLREVYFYRAQLEGHTEREYHPGE